MRPVLLFLLLLLALPGCHPRQPDDPDWLAYRQRFIEGGRVIDRGNGQVSHSESQGFGLVLAEAHADQETFAQIWQWTRHNLQRQDLPLFAWRYDPAASPPVQDLNNASDGDILIAWALQRAADRWQNADYARSATAIRQTIARQLIRQQAGYHLLLPGLQGFERDDHLVLNPSYLIYPALLAFARQAPEEGWEQLIRDSLQLLVRARFGHYRLPPDWLALYPDGRLLPAPGWPARFSYDAVRIPLYLVWGDTPVRSPLLEPFRQFWHCCGDRMPAWTDLENSQQAPYQASPGIRAIAGLLDSPPAPDSPPDPDEGYYSASLRLLARVAARP